MGHSPSHVLLGGLSHSVWSQDWLFIGGKFLVRLEVKFASVLLLESSFYSFVGLAFCGSSVCFLPFLFNQKFF